MILCSFLWRIRWTTLENHRTKQMMVYEQITFFIKHNLYNLFLDRKNDFWIKNKWNRNWIELEPVRTRADRNRLLHPYYHMAAGASPEHALMTLNQL